MILDMSDIPSMIPLARPLMDEREAEAAKRPIMKGWVMQGPEVAAFENEFAAYVGGTHACAVSSCTTALHLGLLAVGVKPGDEVITVSHSFVATANSVRYCGAKPVFVDIEKDTFNLDPRLITRVLSPATRAILCVHQMGMPCNLKEIIGIARQHGLGVVEDCACAIGSEISWNGEWQKIGKPQADVACFSFHPRKIITTGDGGMITTANAEWDRKFRLWRLHGMSAPTATRHGAKEVLFESYLDFGFNYRMTDIQAAIGRVQIQRLPEIVQRRRFLAERYRTLLADVPEIVLPYEPAWARSNWQSYCVRLPHHCDQRQVMQEMLDAGVSTRRGIMCSHREPVYAREPWSCGLGPGACGCPAGQCQRLAESERAQDRTIVLPLYHQLTESEQDRVVEVLRNACRLEG
jgi:dTDP-4-amino-4,6-dideoxygalactose transaminase